MPNNAPEPASASAAASAGCRARAHHGADQRAQHRGADHARTREPPFDVRRQVQTARRGIGAPQPDCGAHHDGADRDGPWSRKRPQQETQARGEQPQHQQRDVHPGDEGQRQRPRAAGRGRPPADVADGHGHGGQHARRGGGHEAAHQCRDEAFESRHGVRSVAATPSRARISPAETLPIVAPDLAALRVEEDLRRHQLDPVARDVAAHLQDVDVRARRCAPRARAGARPGPASFRGSWRRRWRRTRPPWVSPVAAAFAPRRHRRRLRVPAPAAPRARSGRGWPLPRPTARPSTTASRPRRCLENRWSLPARSDMAVLPSPGRLAHPFGDPAFHGRCAPVASASMAGAPRVERRMPFSRASRRATARSCPAPARRRHGRPCRR